MQTLKDSLELKPAQKEKANTKVMFETKPLLLPIPKRCVQCILFSA